jgi:4-diphosphocytidyl-2-C-methyl-D-erythritol kinase
MKYSPEPLVVKSFAKLNLYLQILKKRKDDFHNLNTLFTRIDLFDTIILKERDDGLIKIKCDCRKVPEDSTNLCYRAAALLKQEFKLKAGLEIEIKKRIPVGAGLGGGSSDAAGVLLGLNKFWKLNLTRVRLAGLGAEIGSDVPFFIYQKKFALGSGRGDKIKPLSALNNLKLWFILVYPDFKVSTPLIYRKLDAYRSGKEKFSPLTRNFKPNPDVQRPNIKQYLRLTRPVCNVKMLILQLSKKGNSISPECLFNDLEMITGNLYPAVNKIKNVLSGMGLDKVMMSGSGPAVFAICASSIQARKLKSKLHKKHKSWQVFVVSTI